MLQPTKPAVEYFFNCKWLRDFTDVTGQCRCLAPPWLRDKNLPYFWCEDPMPAVYRHSSVHSTCMFITELYLQRSQHKSLKPRWCEMTGCLGQGLATLAESCNPTPSSSESKNHRQSFKNRGAPHIARKAKIKVSIEIKRGHWELKLHSENYRFYVISNTQIVQAWVIKQV